MQSALLIRAIKSLYSTILFKLNIIVTLINVSIASLVSLLNMVCVVYFQIIMAVLTFDCFMSFLARFKNLLQVEFLSIVFTSVH
jgi:hypothetical protein